MRKKAYDDDDGRVIADMNIEGTPWYVKESHLQDNSPSEEYIPDMKATFHIMRGALTAGLLIGFVFIAAFFLFLLFCMKVWFK
ncbi:MAG: hypothetical protein GXZ01_05120 [Clostridiaceae bacterium]|jgi:hypothetical protein|nr:hypothetical protein [Clostridiaceae bacterium]